MAGDQLLNKNELYKKVHGYNFSLNEIYNFKKLGILPSAYMRTLSDCDIHNINQAFILLTEAETKKEKNSIMRMIRTLVKEANKNPIRTWYYTFKPLAWKTIWNSKD